MKGYSSIIPVPLRRVCVSFFKTAIWSIFLGCKCLLTNYEITNLAKELKIKILEEYL